MLTTSLLSQQLFVELALDDEHRYFEFLPNDERAFTVGSSARAHWCVDRHGLSPIAFHLEREHDEIYVTPGYGTELRLNSRLVKRRARLSPRAMLEFHGIALRARILRELPDGAPSNPATSKRFRSNLFARALDGATVPVGVIGVHRSPNEPDLGHDTEPVQYFMTEVIQVLPPGSAEHVPTAPAALPRAPSPSPTIDGSFSVLLPRSIDTQTTAFEAVQPSRITASAPSPRLERSAPVEAAAKVSAPLAQPSLALKRTAWLARLGLLTKERPVPVLVTTLGVALLLGVLAANLKPLFTSTRASAKTSGVAKPSVTSRPAAEPLSSVESAAPSTSPPPRALVVKVVTPSANAPERGPSPAAKISDPALARAVAALGAGRYAEAARAYSSVAARAPDSEVYRAIARLLEKATSSDCTPSRSAKPSCPKVEP